MESIQKAKLDSILDSPKKKRGRPRKNKNTLPSQKLDNNKKSIEYNEDDDEDNNEPSTFNQEDNKDRKEDEDEIILHIPFNFDDLNTSIKKDNTKKENSSQDPVNIFTIADLSDNDTSDGDQYDDYNTNPDLIKKLREKDDIIRKLEETITEYKKLFTESNMSGLNECKVTKLDLNLINIDTGDKIELIPTNICCWWCTEQFNTLPCFLPEKYEDNKYHVYGCFCSYNCAAAYNLDIDDYKVWDRFSLIKKLSKDMFNNDTEIHVAPPRQALQKFGGILTIEQFRKNFIIHEKEYRHIVPPMVSIVTMIEEIYKNTGKWDKIKSSNPEDNLILKRTTPLPNSKNSLIHTMGITIK